MMDAVFQFNHLSKRVRNRILFEVSELKLHAGRCVLLTGSNGSGKTTLLKIIAGLEAPDTGEVYLNHKHVSWKRARPQFQHEVIYLHQQAYMFDASVRDNIAYGLRQRKVPNDKIRKTVDEALDWAELDHLAQHNAHQLSGGEKQRVALARAWVLSPKLLLLDEATANMDLASRVRTYEQISRLKAEGIGVILTSHETKQVIPLADQHLHLEDGSLRTIDNTLTNIPHVVTSHKFPLVGMR